MCREETNAWTVVNPVQYNGGGTAAAEGLDSRRGAYQPNHRGHAAITSSSEKCSAQGQRLAPSAESIPTIMLLFIPVPASTSVAMITELSLPLEQNTE